MRRRQFIFIFIFNLIFFTTGYATVPVTDNLAPMLEKVSPAIVNIRADVKVTDINLLLELQKRSKKEGANKNFDPNTATFVSVASGVVVDADKGYILTNAHVVADAQTITVTLSDRRHFTAKPIGMDKPSDIALLQIKAKNLTGIRMGNSNLLKVGDVVIAIGNPFGLNQSVTSGIVSALGRTTLGIESFENFIQTDASINPGNSGGALINREGELIGINTAILAPARGNIGIGFAIPINMAKSVMQQLLEYGNVKRGLLGIGAQDITPDLATALKTPEKKGAVVAQVLPQSPAQEAGLKEGDIITSINGIPVHNGSDVVNTIGFLRVNSRANLSIMRDQKTFDVTVSLIDPKKRQALIAETDPLFHGVGFSDFKQSSPLYGNVQGVVVTAVDRDSNAWHADLRPGDVITTANQQKVSTILELRTIAEKTGNELLLHILRGNSAFFIVISKDA